MTGSLHFASRSSKTTSLSQVRTQLLAIITACADLADLAATTPAAAEHKANAARDHAVALKRNQSTYHC